MDMLYHTSHRKHDPQSAFIYQLARLVLLIVKADVPPPLAYLFIHGGIAALHKEDHATQAETAAKGLPPPLREIHNGCVFLKQGLRLMTRHKFFLKVN